MTLSDHRTFPQQRTARFDPEPAEIRLPAQDRTEPRPEEADDESHLIRGYD